MTTTNPGRPSVLAGSGRPRRSPDSAPRMIATWLVAAAALLAMIALLVVGEQIPALLAAMVLLVAGANSWPPWYGRGARQPVGPSAAPMAVLPVAATASPSARSRAVPAPVEPAPVPVPAPTSAPVRPAPPTSASVRPAAPTPGPAPASASTPGPVSSSVPPSPTPARGSPWTPDPAAGPIAAAAVRAPVASDDEVPSEPEDVTVSTGPPSRPPEMRSRSVRATTVSGNRARRRTAAAHPTRRRVAGTRRS